MREEAKTKNKKQKAHCRWALIVTLSRKNSFVLL